MPSRNRPTRSLHYGRVSGAAGLCAAILLLVNLSHAFAERLMVSLDGKWALGESVGADDMPGQFPHTVVVPGLASQAKPPFADVNQYATDERMGNWSQQFPNYDPAKEGAKKGLGRTHQKRDYFWCQRTFKLPERRGRAALVVNKAQYGMAVWLNGKKVGEHLGCATAGIFDVSQLVDWTGENRLVIRIGAHPGALPDWATPGFDATRVHWAPGIYDRVWLQLADTPTIETVQVAPRIAKFEILVQTRIKNHGPARECELVQRVATWKEGRAVGQPLSRRLRLAENEELVVDQTVPVPNAILWSPDNPALYTLETTTGGDSCSTRFGMREFCFDPATCRPMLNGKPCYLRGASFELQRFFGDPKCGELPWNEAWVRKILVDLPRSMHWNCFRAMLGPVPQQWLDIADEGGILLQYEFPLWAPESRYRHWNKEDLIGQYRDFMRDSWNHPSVVIWDASNETRWDFLGDKLIPAVRGLDLSGRPWENSYNKPQGATDPFEHHPYLFWRFTKEPLAEGETPHLDMRFVEQLDMSKPGRPLGYKEGHASIINEYDWLWLHRDGTPTLLSRRVYEKLLGPDAASRQRRELVAYIIGGLTEHFRASRQYAGVLFYTYLALDDPRANTCDYFSDVQSGVLEPHFADYMREAYKPLGVYIHFWQPNLTAGQAGRYKVMLVNDAYEPAQGRLELLWESDQGEVLQRTEIPYGIDAVGQKTYELELAAPQLPGKHVLMARAFWGGKPFSPTVSRRKVSVDPAPSK